MKAQISEATLADKAQLNQISWEAKGYWGYPPEWMEEWKEGLKLKEEDFSQHYIYKLVLGHRIIGFCVVWEEDKQYEIEHLWILPDFIGKGFGKYLLHECLKKVVTKKKPIIVVADPNAEAFYIRQGFETYDQKASTPEGRFLPLMRK